MHFVVGLTYRRRGAHGCGCSAITAMMVGSGGGPSMPARPASGRLAAPPATRHRDGSTLQEGARTAICADEPAGWHHGRACSPQHRGCGEESVDSRPCRTP